MLKTLRTELNKHLSEYTHFKTKVKEEKTSLLKASDHLSSCEEARKLVQIAAQAIQNKVHQKLSSVVTRCLKAVFGEEGYEFRINFLQKRGKTEAQLVFLRNGKEVDPTFSSGGGVLDVASFALRLSCLMLYKPPKRKFLSLDEPWKHLSSEYRPAVKTLIETLAKELDFQFLIVTHSPEFAFGNVVEIT